MRINYDNFEEVIQDLIASVELVKNEYPDTLNVLKGADFDDYDVQDAETMFYFAVELTDADPENVIQKDVAAFLYDLLLDIAENDENETAIRASASNHLGALYYGGRIGEQNYDKALELYTFAANNGDAYAQENLGYIWYYGRTGKKDYEKAFNCFLKGALNGRPISMYKIGDMYKNGYYVEKDPVQAFKVYESCQDLMNNDENIYTAGPDVSMRLADCYFDGIGTEQDYKTALMFYQQAERIYYDRIGNGDFLFRDSLKHVIVNEQICRQKLLTDLPDFEWTKDM